MCIATGKINNNQISKVVTCEKQQEIPYIQEKIMYVLYLFWIFSIFTLFIMV